MSLINTSRTLNAVEFESLKGETLISITLDKPNEEIIFVTAGGRKYVMGHMQDCCENVWVEDIIGDPNDLLYTPIERAEEVIQSGYSEDESYTWSFYKLATIKGEVTIRWNGTSNGYYSETVHLFLDANHVPVPAS